MDTMNCKLCVLKHIAVALSYAKEILSGHSYGNELDHRIDFLGELVNLEHHLLLYDRNFLLNVKHFRELLQNRFIHVDLNDLNYLRKLYLDLEHKLPIQKGIEQFQKLDDLPAILFLDIKDLEYFDLCYKKLKLNLHEYTNIYCLNSNIDLTNYSDIIKIDYKEIKEQDLLIFNLQTIVVHPYFCKIKIAFTKEFIYPCLVKRDEFYPFLQLNNSLKKYAESFKYEVILNQSFGFVLNKKLCCLNRGKLYRDTFCYVLNKEALNSLKEQFNKK